MSTVTVMQRWAAAKAAAKQGLANALASYSEADSIVMQRTGQVLKAIRLDLGEVGFCLVYTTRYPDSRPTRPEIIRGTVGGYPIDASLLRDVSGHWEGHLKEVETAAEALNAVTTGTIVSLWEQMQS